MKNNKNIKKRTRFSAGEIYYETIACKITTSEYEKINKYCIDKNISKSYFMALATMYFIENNIDVDEINNSGENHDDTL